MFLKQRFCLPRFMLPTFLCVCLFSLLSLLSFACDSELIGEELRLQTFSDNEVIYVGASMAALNALVGNLFAGHDPAYQGIILGGEGFVVTNGTSAVLLALCNDSHCAQIKITDGTYKGRVGWVLLSHVCGY